MLLNLHGNRTYNILYIGLMVYFFLPYTGAGQRSAIASFLFTMFQLPMTISPIVHDPELLARVQIYDMAPDIPSLTKLISAKDTLSMRLLEKDRADKLLSQQSKNQYLLIAALVRADVNVDRAYQYILDFAIKVPLEERITGDRKVGEGKRRAK